GPAGVEIAVITASTGAIALLTAWVRSTAFAIRKARPAPVQAMLAAGEVASRVNKPKDAGAEGGKATAIAIPLAPTASIFAGGTHGSVWVTKATVSPRSSISIC